VEVFLFDQLFWPAWPHRELLPYPGSLWNAQQGMDWYAAHLNYMRRADEVGFDGICLTEHHFQAHGCPAPNVLAAAVAAQTQQAKIAIVGNCVPLHGHPVRLAEELAMVDVLSRGRLRSGFLRGGFTEWYAYNVDPAEARGRFEEAFELIVKCWTEPEPFAWHGKYYRYENVSIMPRPVQQPHPPIIMAGSTAESLEWAARKRVPIASSFAPTERMGETFDYYRQYAREQCGWTPGPEHFLVSRQVYVAPTNTRARAEAEEHILRFFQETPVARRYGPEVERYRTAQRSERSFRYREDNAAYHAFLVEDQERAAARGGTEPAFTWDQLQRDGMCIIGDPDYVVQEMRRQQAVLGVGTFFLYIPFSTLPLAQATASIELFAREVLPHLRD
jgi:alkanesulfonate monooxygenase SsuD/methylene tetrahydromethanopterin reductase-like flavin-dependent oxidoreductase (luciferase family)